MEKILLLHAKAEAGKDTCAQLMKEEYEAVGKSVIIIAFADLVRFLLKEYYDVMEFKSPQGRSIIQHFATEKIRGQDELFWARHVATFLSFIQDDFDVAIIPDWRFKNELEQMLFTFDEETVVPILITRANVCSVDNMTELQRKHISETELDDLDESFYSFIIRNDGGLEALRANVQNVLNKI